MPAEMVAPRHLVPTLPWLSRTPLLKDTISSIEGGQVSDGTPKPDRHVPPKAGKILLSIASIKGQNGRALLALQSNTSRLCEFVTSDPFTLTPTAMTDNPGKGNPCDSKTAPTLFKPGTHAITVGIYIPGKQVPETSTTINVTVNGDTTFKVNGALLSRP